MPEIPPLTLDDANLKHCPHAPTWERLRMVYELGYQRGKDAKANSAPGKREKELMRIGLSELNGSHEP